MKTWNAADQLLLNTTKFETLTGTKAINWYQREVSSVEEPQSWQGCKHSLVKLLR